MKQLFDESAREETGKHYPKRMNQNIAGTLLNITYRRETSLYEETSEDSLRYEFIVSAQETDKKKKNAI